MQGSQSGPIGAYRKLLSLLVVILVVGATGGCRVTSMGQNTLGVRLYQQGRYSEALQQFQTAQVSDPSNPDTYLQPCVDVSQVGCCAEGCQADRASGIAVQPVSRSATEPRRLPSRASGAIGRIESSGPRDGFAEELGG